MYSETVLTYTEKTCVLMVFCTLYTCKIKEQIAFLENLEGAKAKIFVCSYENELYNEILCKNFGWKCVPVTDTYKYMAVSGLGQSKERVTEVGDINYDHKECR